MKKIMFNDKFGLTAAVVAGRKTMTRRIIPPIEIDWNRRGKVRLPISGYKHRTLWIDCRQFLPDSGPFDYVAPQKYQPHYDIGEDVAIAESYEMLANSRHRDVICMMDSPTTFKKEFCGAGWSNKMFVAAEYMPHVIRITNIKLERLQDISNEDAMREGIFHYEKPPLHHEMDRFAPWPPYVKPYKWDGNNLKYFCEARYAFAHLIDKVSGVGTWRMNPWVYVYEFELIK